MMRLNICADCGRRIRLRYTRCYTCQMRRRRSKWRDPEHLTGQTERDAKLGRNKFFVYLLDTDYGHYVGHTANVRARLNAHKADEVQSTAGGNPKLLWTSGSFPTREDAARFEAALKSLRDQAADRFHEITAHEPTPFVQVPTSGSGCGLQGIALIAAVAAAVLIILGIIY